jgi:hypothetical protein
MKIELLSTMQNPASVKISWDGVIYKYNLDSPQDVNKFLYLKQKAGITKAVAWLKKISYSTEKL